MTVSASRDEPQRESCFTRGSRIISCGTCCHNTASSKLIGVASFLQCGWSVHGTGYGSCATICGDRLGVVFGRERCNPIVKSGEGPTDMPLDFSVVGKRSIMESSEMITATLRRILQGRHRHCLGRGRWSVDIGLETVSYTNYMHACMYPYYVITSHLDGQTWVELHPQICAARIVCSPSTVAVLFVDETLVPSFVLTKTHS